MTADSPACTVVLGAGGALGAAWMLGALHALRVSEDFDPRASEAIVGTSAGSVLAALVAHGADVVELARDVAAAGPPHVSGTGPVNVFDVHETLASIPRPRMLPGNLWLSLRSLLGEASLTTVAAGLAPRGRGDLTPVSGLVADAAAGRPWPERPGVRVVAMDFDSGRRVVFGAPGAPAVELAGAVAASCAAPGFFPPVPLAGHRYVDGGAVSLTNADVALEAGAGDVLVLAPMSGRSQRPARSALERFDRRLRRLADAQLARETRRLRAAGRSVRVLVPTAEDLEVIGANVMNPRRRHEVVTTAFRTTTAALAAARQGIA